MRSRSILLRNHSCASFRIGLRHRNLHGHQPRLSLRCLTGKRVISHNPRVVICRHLFFLRFIEYVRQHPKRMIRSAVQRITIRHPDQPCRCRALVALRVVIVSHSVITFGDHLLHFPQMLHRFICQRILRIFQQERLEFALRLSRFGAIPVRFLHLSEVPHGHLQLRVRSLRKEREEHDKIFVARDGLRHIGRPALFIIRVGD